MCAGAAVQPVVWTPGGLLFVDCFLFALTFERTMIYMCATVFILHRSLNCPIACMKMRENAAEICI